MNVSACIVTRGDVDLSPILDSLLLAGFEETIIWDNSQTDDLAVYGRYAAIEHARGELIYVQDDDVIVSDPMQIVRAHDPQGKMVILDGPKSYVTCNMPPAFRHAFYKEHALAGFGACFHRDAPERAFQRWGAATMKRGGALEGTTTFVDEGRWSPFFLRTCDIVFTALTPRVLVDVSVANLPWASDDSRMWKQPEHVAERTRMLDLALAVRDG